MIGRILLRWAAVASLLAVECGAGRQSNSMPCLYETLAHSQGKTVVNPKNQANRKRRAELASLVSAYEEEIDQWEAARKTLTGKAAEAAAAAAAALDDGTADTATAQEYAAASNATRQVVQLAATATIAAGALKTAAKAAAATADDAKALVGAAGASVHSAAFRGVARGAPQSAAALVRGMTGSRR